VRPRRAIVAALGLCAAVLAWAQDSERQFEAGRSADFQNWQWRASQGRALSEADKAVQAVTDAVMRRDCADAAAKLNEGLKKAYPEVLVLAGAMAQEGLCLKPNWERALGFYQRAVSAGHPGAAARVAAGYASAAGGRDKAAALWWALRAKTALPAACTQVAALADDADRFVAALSAWPAGQLDGCAYVAAVMAAVQSEVEGPALATAYGFEGKVRLSFAPDQGRIEIAEDVAPVTPASVVLDAGVRERNEQAARAALSDALRQLADRSLRRFDKPAGLSAAWRVESEIGLKAAR
jgi:TPR repeat protein